MRRVLEGHSSVSAQDWIISTPAKTMIFFGGLAAMKPEIDGIAVTPDGWLYLADSAIPDQVMRSKRHIASQAPYFIFRFQPGGEGVPGH